MPHIVVPTIFCLNRYFTIANLVSSTFQYCLNKWLLFPALPFLCLDWLNPLLFVWYHVIMISCYPRIHSQNLQLMSLHIMRSDSNLNWAFFIYYLETANIPRYLKKMVNDLQTSGPRNQTLLIIVINNSSLCWYYIYY